MLWLKAFHVIFMVTWFAGLFYLPRLFVYHSDTQDAVSHDRFVIMERRLFILMTIGAALTAAFGSAMILRAPGLLDAGWLMTKFALVGALIAYHAMCFRAVTAFREGRNTRSSKWYRGFNEIPSVLLITIVLLAVLKPF